MPVSDSTQRTLSRLWFTLAVGSLLLPGILALLLVIARMPPFSNWITDPLLFKRCLVVHVVLSLFVWFCAFLMLMYSRLPRDPRFIGQEIAALVCAFGGVAMMVIAAGMPGSMPILSNYLPVIDHPLFLGGLVIFAIGIGLQILQPRLLPGGPEADNTIMPGIAQAGLRAAGVAVLFALITIWAAWWNTPGDLGANVYFEHLFWGGGHVFQFANTCGMLVAWTALTVFATEQWPCSRRTAFWLFSCLLLPVFVAPLLTLSGTTTAIYRTVFTSLMQWGIFPVVLIFMFMCGRRFFASEKPSQTLKSVRLGFLISAGLTLLGFVLGALIRGSNTLIPAHYHANIGAVTCAYMTLTYVLLPELGYRFQSMKLRGWAQWQPATFGFGQAIFALGFGLAGSYGMGRKLYGQEQSIQHLGATTGLVVMGIGGLIAIVGGITYLILTLHAIKHPIEEVPTAAHTPRERLASR